MSPRGTRDNSTHPPCDWMCSAVPYDSFDFVGAIEGMCPFGTFLDVDASGLALSRVLGKAGVSDGAAIVMESVRTFLRPSTAGDVRVMFNRPKFVRAPSRAVASTGFQMCSDLAALAPEGKDPPRGCAGPRREKRREFAQGGAQWAQSPAREGLPWGHSDSALYSGYGRPGVRHWSDKVHAPPEKRASSERTARRPARGSPSKSVDYCSGVKAASSEAPAEG